MAKEVISKRNFIHANIIEELNAKYPLYSEKNGVAYSRDLKYITFEPSVDIDADIVSLDVKVGFGVFNVIFYFAEEMMKGGYKVRVDGYNLERHCLTCAGKYGVPADKVRKIVESLVNCNYFFKIADEDFDVLYNMVITKNLSYPQILYYCLIYDIGRQKKENLQSSNQ